MIHIRNRSLNRFMVCVCGCVYTLCPVSAHTQSVSLCAFAVFGSVAHKSIKIKITTTTQCKNVDPMSAHTTQQSFPVVRTQTHSIDVVHGHDVCAARVNETHIGLSGSFSVDG